MLWLFSEIKTSIAIWRKNLTLKIGQFFLWKCKQTLWFDGKKIKLYVFMRYFQTLCSKVIIVLRRNSLFWSFTADIIRHQLETKKIEPSRKAIRHDFVVLICSNCFSKVNGSMRMFVDLMVGVVTFLLSVEKANRV